MALLSGTKLGPYEIQSSLGAGGMGEVYRARDTRLERDVAVKVLPANLSSDPSSRQRLEREAKAVSKLSHPHICTLHDVGHQDGVDFLVMELVEGETLEHRLTKGPLPLEQTIRFATQIANALAKAHKRGITHRDLKPSNIMLTKSGTKLMDFGLAKESRPAVTASALTEMTAEQSKLTVEGTIVGTFQYMAPEQLEGKEADARTDIFALGEVIYEMATGEPAFAGKSRANLIAAILSCEPQSMVALQPMTPPALERVVKKCLAKDPDDRWQSASDLASELNWIGEAGSPTGAPVVKYGHWLAVIVAAALLGILVLSLLAIWLLRPETKPDLIQAYISAPQKSTFELANDDASGPAVISPAGHYLAFVAADEQGKHQIWVRDLAQNASSVLPGTEAAIYPFWSPDEKSLGFFAEGKLKRVDIRGGPVLSLCDAQRPRGGSWGSNGNIIFAAEPQTTISVISERGGTPHSITHMESYHTTHRWPLFLPDGRRFFYLATNHQSPDASERNGIYVASLDGNENRFLLPANSSVVVASGYVLFLQNDVLMAQPFDASRAQLTGDPLPLGFQVYRNAGTWRAGFDASRDGLLVYHPAAGESGSQLLWIDRSGKILAPLGERHAFRSISLSPDGRKVAVVDLGAPLSIWIYDVIRGARSRFTFEGTGDDSPVWSPDGARIAFAQRHGGPFDIYVKNANGTGTQELVFASPESKTVWDWSSDGRYLLIGMGRPAALWLVPLLGERKAQPLLRGPYPIWNGAFSPDGRWLAYESDETGRNEVYVTRFPSLQGKWQISSGGRSMAWRRDGKAIFYMSSDGSLSEAALTTQGDDLGVGAVKPLFKLNNVNFSPLHRLAIAVNADGNRFLIIKPEEGFSTLNLMIHWTAAIKK